MLGFALPVLELQLQAWGQEATEGGKVPEKNKDPSTEEINMLELIWQLLKKIA